MGGKKNEKKPLVRWFDELTGNDAAEVGGKNASLGEMIRNLKRKGIQVPDGFATTAAAFWRFVEENNMADKLKQHLAVLRKNPDELRSVGKKIREMFRRGKFPRELEAEIRKYYRELSEKSGGKKVSVAVRSSATAEDLPTASFAGQQETYLNITGEKAVLSACRNCFASLFTDRAIRYRENKGFDHLKVALSAGIQRIVRSDKGSAGVMFTLDTESGFPRVASINGAWGLGEVVVKGTVTPDEFSVFKPLVGKKRPIIQKTLGSKEKKLVFSRGRETTRHVNTPKKDRQRFCLNDDEILRLADWGSSIEAHYNCPMDIEWAKDGETGALHIVQARPETVHSARQGEALKHYRLKEHGRKLVEGLSIGDAIAAGKVCRIRNVKEIGKFREGTVLVTTMTDPDWVAVMKKARGIITDLGGRTCHAAIVSRELGIPAVVGTGNATEKLKDGQEVTLSCAEGSKGFLYKGKLKYDEIEIDPEKLPKTRTKIMLNLANPDAAFQWWRLPADGVGLARMEFIINNAIKIHPMALVNWKGLKDRDARRKISRLTAGYNDKPKYFVDHLAMGIARIAAFAYPDPVIVRLSDFKTNEYADLIGGAAFEPKEDNPMIGFRGASRYYSEQYEKGFALECQALRRVREEMGFENLIVMVPFCRTLKEADLVLKTMAKHGLKRGKGGLQVYVMCEIPSNVILAREFAERFDGFSIGSNDLTQLVLGIDRDSRELAEIFDERDEAVRFSIHDVIRAGRKTGRKVGICGEAPSNYPDFARFLVEQGIDSMSLNPDSFVDVKRQTARIEKKRKK